MCEMVFYHVFSLIPSLRVCAACVQAGAGGVHEGADPLDIDRLLRQSALHQPHRGQDGHP